MFECEIFSTNVQEIIAVSAEKIDFQASHLWDSIASSSINISGVHFLQNTFLVAIDIDMK